MGWVTGFSTNETARFPGVADQSEKRLAPGADGCQHMAISGRVGGVVADHPCCGERIFGNWREDDNCQDLILFIQEKHLFE